MERLTYVKKPSQFDRGKYPTKYTSRHTFQEVVARLAAYEDTGLEPEEIQRMKEYMKPFTIRDIDRFNEIMQAEKDGRLVVLPPNDPLTPEQLREMDRKPVWICDPDGSDGMWALVDLEYELCRTATGGIAIFDTYGKTWLAYRRKPEEGTTA